MALFDIVCLQAGFQYLKIGTYIYPQALIIIHAKVSQDEARFDISKIHKLNWYVPYTALVGKLIYTSKP